MQDISSLKRLSKEIAKNYPVVSDIVLFGSSTRGKLMPNDLDIAVILKSKIPTDAIKNKFKNAHVVFLEISTCFNPNVTLWKTVLHEGYSLVKEKKISELFGFNSSSLFWYTLKGLSYSQKIKFHYALKGRGKQAGLLNEAKGTNIGRGVILVPSDYEDKLKEFFKTWKISYHKKRVLIA